MTERSEGVSGARAPASRTRMGHGGAAPEQGSTDAQGATTATATAPTDDQALLSGVALRTFRLNGQLLEVAEELARPAGLTAAWWQVLGAVLDEPRTVAGIARVMGITRQSVQRIADLLVTRDLAAYRDNPAHRRAKLLAPTPAGMVAIRAIGPGHAALAERLADRLGRAEFGAALAALEALSGALDDLAAHPPD